MKVSKRDQLAAARRAELALASTDHPAGSGPSAVTSPAPSEAAIDSTQAEPPAAVDASPVQGSPASVPIAVDAVQMRARGAGVDRLMGSLQSGLAGQLAKKSDDLARAEAELEELRPLKELADGTAMPVREIDPATVLPTRFKNRDAKSFDENDREFKAFLDEIQRTGGNEIPGFVRPLATPEGPYRYECVYGHRRLQAVLLLKLPYRAIVSDVEDDQAVLLQQAENSSRKKLSSIERGQQIASYLARFRKMETGRVTDGTLQLLANALKTDSKYLSKFALIGQIPQSVLDVIPDVREVPFKPAYLLARACRDTLKEVEARVTSVQPDETSRRVVSHLLGADKRPAPVASRYSISMPGDHDVREAFMAIVEQFEARFGVHLVLKELPE